MDQSPKFPAVPTLRAIHQTTHQLQGVSFPAPLPPNLRSGSIPKILGLLSQADRASAASMLDPNPAQSRAIRIHVRTARKPCFPARSRALKVPSTDLLVAEAKSSRRTAKDVAEVINYVPGYELRPQAPNRTTSLHPTHREIHAEILKGVRGFNPDSRRIAALPELDGPGRMHARRSRLHTGRHQTKFP